jgi:hypothetical protein
MYAGVDDDAIDKDPTLMAKRTAPLPVILLALNVSQASRAFGTGLRTEHIRQLILEGKLTARAFHGRKLISVADLQRWFESLPIAPVLKPKTKRGSPHA